MNIIMRWLTVLLLVSIVITSPILAETPREWVTVTSIADGDTIRVKYMGRKELVRLIGIDTPESTANEKAVRQSTRSHADISTILKKGKRAATYTSSRVKSGEKVQLEFDVERRDQYGRLLAYVYLHNNVMLNEDILKAGYAKLLTFPPNVRYVKRFSSALRDAKLNKRGLWGKS